MRITVMPAKRPSIIAHHLIWTLYGHWLPNDPRGSGSEAVRDPKFEPIGEHYHGRKLRHEQPSRGELRAFYEQAKPLLDYRVFWIDEAKRQAIANAITGVVSERKYTVWACAILSNHMHMVIRRHRDDALSMWNAISDGTRPAVRGFVDVDLKHPVWAARPYKVFLRTPEEVRGRIEYVEGNPVKEGLPEQQYCFVQSYDNWPFHKLRLTRR
jgi:REP-associated tyrosine transposase